jgi:hypothetical protein
MDTFGIRREEVVWPERGVERHIASGSGWDDRPGERGGGRVPARNPWREDRHVKNPAQDGSTQPALPRPS